MQELDDLIRESIDYELSKLSICFPGRVIDYSPEHRRASIQPSIKRLLPNGKYQKYPILVDVPVQFPGCQRFVIHFPLIKGDEVAVHFSQRSIDRWKESVASEDVEDPDPRKFDLSDGYCTPGLQANDFFPTTDDKALEIIHLTEFDGDVISHVLINDEKIDVKYKKKSRVTMEDDHINAHTEKCASDMMGDVLKANNSKCSLELNEDDFKGKSNKCTFEMTGQTVTLQNGKDTIKADNGTISLENGNGNKIEMGTASVTINGANLEVLK